MRNEHGQMFSGISSAVSVAAAQDIFELTAASTGKGIRVHRVEFCSDGTETSEVLPMQLKVAKGTFTAGTGGAAVTETRLKTGDGTNTAALTRNNTSAASAGTGSLTIVSRRSFNLVTGYVYAPTEAECVTLAPGEAFIVNLPTAPAGATTCSGEIIWEELN